jgi:hypothetical protein
LTIVTRVFPKPKHKIFKQTLLTNNSKKIHKQKNKQKLNIHKGLEFRKNIYKNNGFKGYEFWNNIYKQWGWKLRNKITHFSLIKITKMYTDNYFWKKYLGLWISCTLTNKNTSYIYKQIYYKNLKNKAKIE